MPLATKPISSFKMSSISLGWYFCSVGGGVWIGKCWFPRKVDDGWFGITVECDWIYPDVGNHKLISIVKNPI